MKDTLPISELEKMFAVTGSDLNTMIGDFHSEMKRGLEGEQSSLKMLPSFVTRPRGTEKGEFLALDLGGTNLRVLAVHLDGQNKATITASEKFVIEPKFMCGDGYDLFDFIAECIKNFLHKAKITSHNELDLAFTFSFPVLQTALSAGTLIKWTKGFTATGVEGKDVILLLKRSLERKGLQFIKLVALVNDTVGTLAAKNYSDPACDMGVILGTGTNACYAEKISNITKNKDLCDGDEMIINMEWGNFSKLKRTSFDIELDKDSQNSGSQFLEKMVSGMYLGEITRRILLPSAKPYSFKTENMSQVAAGDFNAKNLGIEPALLKSVCHIVARRSARISGMAISSVLKWIDPKLENEHTVGIDGSLFENYPGFKNNMIEVFNELFGANAKNIRLEMAKDGSGIGAAVIAAIAVTKPN